MRKWIEEKCQNDMERAVGVILDRMADESEATENIIREDLETIQPEDVIKAMEEVARKKKTGQSYVMSDTEAEEIIREFLKVPQKSNVQSPAQPEEPQVMSLLDML